MIKNKCATALDTTALIFFMLYLFCNVVRNVIVKTIGGMGNIFLILLFFFYFVFIYGNKQNKRISILPFLVFLLFFIVYFQFFWDDSHIYVSFGFPFKAIVWNLIMFVPITISAICINQKSNDKQLALLKDLFIILVFFICVVSIAELLKDPYASKKTATSEGNYVPFLIDYGMVYSLAMIFPILFLYAKQSKKIILWVMVVLICITLFMASYMIALIALILGMVSYLLLSIKSKWLSYTLIFLTICLGIYFIYTNKLQVILLDLSKVIDNELIIQRLEAIVGYLDTGSVDGAGVRFEDYALSVNSIINHPILGSILWDNNVKISGHSTILDIWAGCGLFVLALYLKFNLNIIKENLRNTKGNMSMAIIAMAISFFFISVFNPVFSSPATMFLFVLTPQMFQKQKE